MRLAGQKFWWRVWLWLSVASGCCLAPQVMASDDVYTIRANITINGSDEYHYQNKDSDGRVSETRDSTDSLNYQFTGVQTLTYQGRDSETTEVNQYSGSGGGVMTHVVYHRDKPPEQESANWSYSLDSSLIDLASEDITFNFDNSQRTACSVIPMPQWGIVASNPGGSASIMALNAIILSGPLYIGTIELPTNTSFSITRSYSTNYTVPHTGFGESGQASAQYHATVTIQRNQPEFEAVIFPDPPKPTPLPLTPYENWLPYGGPDEDTAGTNHLVTVIIRLKGSQDTEPYPGVGAQFTFELVDVSREPGICLNFPSKDEAANPGKPDLRIFQADNLEPVENEGQRARTKSKDLNTAAVSIQSFDYGAWGKLQVTASIPGQGEIVAYVEGDSQQTTLTLPKDENDNRIADVWEKGEGVYGRNLPANWDEVDYPADHKQNGDGFGLYERYRGFKFQEQYERLSATNKYVVIYDPDDLVKMMILTAYSHFNSFPAVSKCRTRFVEDSEWTGHGRAAAEKRIVNFNTSGFGHAVDQHAITVQQVMEESPVVPPDWDAMWKTNNEGVSWGSTNSLQGTLGMTWPDYSTEGFDSPKNTFLITIYPPGINREIRHTVVYHTWNAPAYTNYSGLTAAQIAEMQKAVEKAADAYIKANRGPNRQRYYQRMSDVTTHEMGHGLGIKHHEATTEGEPECVMRYFSWDHPRNQNDRFELNARAPWPDIYCRSANHTAGGVGCWFQIKVTDR